MQKDELLDLDVIKIVQQENKNACQESHFDWQLLFVMLYYARTITSLQANAGNIFTAYKMVLGPVRLKSVWFENALEHSNIEHMLVRWCWRGGCG